MKDVRTRTHVFDSNFFIPRENPKQRRLAAAVRPQNADPLSGGDIKRKPVQDIAADFKRFYQ